MPVSSGQEVQLTQLTWVNSDWIGLSFSVLEAGSSSRSSSAVSSYHYIISSLWVREGGETVSDLGLQLSLARHRRHPAGSHWPWQLFEGLLYWSQSDQVCQLVSHVNTGSDQRDTKTGREKDRIRTKTPAKKVRRVPWCRGWCRYNNNNARFFPHFFPHKSLGKGFTTDRWSFL